MPGTDRLSDIMKTIMLESSITSHSYLKKVKDMNQQLKTHNRETLSYHNFQHLLKSCAQNRNQKTRANTPRASRKHDVMSELIEISNSSG